MTLAELPIPEYADDELFRPEEVPLQAVGTQPELGMEPNKFRTGGQSKINYRRVQPERAVHYDIAGARPSSSPPLLD